MVIEVGHIHPVVSYGLEIDVHAAVKDSCGTPIGFPIFVSERCHHWENESGECDLVRTSLIHALIVVPRIPRYPIRFENRCLHVR